MMVKNGEYKLQNVIGKKFQNIAQLIGKYI